MFEDIGGKIKVLAAVLFVVGCIVGFVAAIILFVEELTLLGILALILCPVISWVSSLVLYGFGELIEKVSIIADGNSNEENKPVKPVVITQGLVRTPYQPQRQVNRPSGHSIKPEGYRTTNQQPPKKD